MAPRRRRTLMPKGQTNRSDTWALSAEGEWHRTHEPIGLLALSFFQCLRSVKQSRRLNLSAETGTAGVCMYVCVYVDINKVIVVDMLKTERKSLR